MDNHPSLHRSVHVHIVEGLTMTKEQMLECIKVLSAVESWGFINNQRIPDYLHDKLLDVVDVLSAEILK